MRLYLAPPPASRWTIELETLVPAVSLAGAFLLRLWTVLPGLVPFPIGCLFHAVTGIPCPGCGGTRAIVALTRLDLGAALAFNPAAALAGLGVLGFSLYALVAVALRTPRIRAGELSSADRASAIALVTANWVYLIAAGR